MTEPTTTPNAARPLPLDAIQGVVTAVPRLIDRTRHQAELARSLVALVPCLGFLGRRHQTAPAVDPQPEQVDVISVLSDDVPDLTVVEDLTVVGDDDSGSSGVTAEVTPLRPAPTESDLPVQDYDSLAASQVVPRLATLGADELLAVQAYELAHRNRQTILNRVAQLLAG